MIEKEFIRTTIKNLRVRSRINEIINKGAGCGRITIEKTPLGERIIIEALRPGLVIGRGGETIKQLTAELKSRYKMENPQIEVRELQKPNLVAATVAKRIADEMEKFGPRRFKLMGYRALSNILKEGAMGAEIVISGRGIPSQRSKTWRFYGGYLKKCGDIAVNKIDKAIERANLRSGTVGIVVKIMLPNTQVPDKVTIKEQEIKIEELKQPPSEIKDIGTESEKKPTKTAEKTKKEPERKKRNELQKTSPKKAGGRA